MSDKVLISIKNIKKSFDKQVVINSLNLDIMDGEFLTLLGPSGCGKTTLLRMINGFEKPDEGTISLDGESMDQIPPNKRQVNTVFQSYALFPHLTVRDNIAFPLKMKKVPEKEIKERVDEVLELTNLESLAKRKPSKLSGGQQQRVAIARSLVNRPKVLLLDEPLGALDLKLRKQMQIELKKMQRRLGITYVYVTHDQEEALTISDRIVVLNKGNIEQMGEPSDIYHNPNTEFVASFLGESNFFDGYFSSEKFMYHNISLPYSETSMAAVTASSDLTESFLLSVRPEYIHITKKCISEYCIKSTVKAITYLGQILRVEVLTEFGNTVHILYEDNDLKKEEVVYIYWKAENGILIHHKED